MTTTPGVWYFSQLQPTGTLLAIEPNGTEHVVRLCDWNSTAGINLLNAMVRDLAANPEPKNDQHQ